MNKGWISALRAMVVSILTGSVLVFWFFAVGKVEPDNPGLGYALDGHENVTCCYYGEVVNSDLQERFQYLPMHQISANPQCLSCAEAVQ